MHSMVLAQTQKPLVSLLDDATPAQRHKGWEFGFLDGFANQTRKIHHLIWEVSPPAWPFPPSEGLSNQSLGLAAVSKSLAT